MGLQYGAFMKDWTYVSEHEVPFFPLAIPANASITPESKLVERMVGVEQSLS
jgi:hypothetical protein